MEKNDITTKVLIALVSLMLVAVIVLGYLLRNLHLRYAD